MFGLGLQIERVIEGRHPVDLAERYPQSSRDISQCFKVEVPKKFLDWLQAFDEGVRPTSVTAHSGVHQWPATVF
jgi:hypothetical protein